MLFNEIIYDLVFVVNGLREIYAMEKETKIPKQRG